jgi:hypothetical protein
LVTGGYNPWGGAIVTAEAPPTPAKEGWTMTAKEKLLKVLDNLPELRQYEVLDFARYVLWLEKQAKEELEDWTRFGEDQFSKCYGPDEPEYTEADLKPEQNP